MKKILVLLVIVLGFTVMAFADGGPYEQIVNGGAYGTLYVCDGTSCTMTAMKTLAFRATAAAGVAVVTIPAGTFTNINNYYVVASELGVTLAANAVAVTKVGVAEVRVYPQGPTSVVSGLIIGY